MCENHPFSEWLGEVRTHLTPLLASKSLLLLGPSGAVGASSLAILHGGVTGLLEQC